MVLLAHAELANTMWVEWVVARVFLCGCLQAQVKGVHINASIVFWVELHQPFVKP